VRYELIIFDCDGVLVDSEPIVNRAHADVMTACGCPIGETELLERFCGMADSGMIRALEAEWKKALPANYPKRVAARIALDYRRSLRPIAGIAELIDGIGVRTCVASSSCAEQLRLALDVTGLLDRFGSRLYSAGMVPLGKPAPDLLLYAAARLGAAPERTIVIEDSLAGVEAAVAARMTVIGFCGGGHCRAGHGARLIARGAVAAADNISSLADVLGRLGVPIARAGERDSCAGRYLSANSGRVTSGET
jgi:HAD superfamily hydrolase (TIGR01509 family)